jgi:hypothetical protein
MLIAVGFVQRSVHSIKVILSNLSSVLHQLNRGFVRKIG